MGLKLKYYNFIQIYSHNFIFLASPKYSVFKIQHIKILPFVLIRNTVDPLMKENCIFLKTKWPLIDTPTNRRLINHLINHLLP